MIRDENEVKPMATTVHQAMTAITTYIEGTTGVKFHLQGVVDDPKAYEKCAKFASNDKEKLSFNTLEIDYEDIDITGKNGGRVNPFSLVINKMGLSLRMDINPSVRMSNKGQLSGSWALENDADNRKLPIDFLDNMLIEGKDNDLAADVSVLAHYRWEHPNGGYNGSSVYFWLREGHILKVDAR
jgi:hypothetical protein